LENLLRAFVADEQQIHAPEPDVMNELRRILPQGQFVKLRRALVKTALLQLLADHKIRVGEVRLERERALPVGDGRLAVVAPRSDEAEVVRGRG
jgi:hypothetical protein